MATPPPAAARFDIEQLLNYRLWKLIALSGAPVTRLCEGHFGITRREWALLGVLRREGDLPPSVLAERAALDRARASRTIGPLVDKGLLVRRAQPGDRRRARVGLTEAGHALVDRLEPQVAAINAQVLSALDAGERAALDVILHKLLAQAARVNEAVLVDVQAARHRGGARRVWNRRGKEDAHGSDDPF